MKQPNFLIVMGFSAVFSASVFAANEELNEDRAPSNVPGMITPVASHCESEGINLSLSDRNALILACLAKSNSPENINAIAMQQKILNCAQNAKNKGLQGSKRDGYITTCIYKNEAILALESINQRFVSSDINEMLRQSPTAAGNK